MRGCAKLGRSILLVLLVWSSLNSAVLGDGDGNSTDSSDKAILRYRPAFTRSLPVQILLTGVIFTLLSLLMIQLLFTARHHWYLSPGNYILQVCGVATLGTSLAAAMYKILSVTASESEVWPYMLSYLSVDIPPLRSDNGWQTAELAAWLLMNGLTSALIQMVHIHFITLLFPNRLVKSLVFAMLVPLAVLHAVVQVLPIWSNPTVIALAPYVSSICSATLSLLFTFLLIIWAFFVNRKQAWRTEGGTAAFGVAAMALSILMTVLAFVYIPHKDQYEWYPELLHAVMMWQSYVGWWWWVGAGVSVGTYPEVKPKSKKDNHIAWTSAKSRMKRRSKEIVDVREVRPDVEELTSQYNRYLRRRTRPKNGDCAQG
ncbi:hypothetical protein NEOLEDRAFT_1127313 [Neolentinus lepideus HHB14362 ss-1]|uniref:Uncharacterized protein n=1 Tax=Neolentinus lepideus HHB14362 ss-1 TaxID=1314782 RepID=A0A165VFJ2_9AGAM|nr:hypothetical protein NEOLEDRAFT_1127313 [Neolentinus lepideus HHB14362 ss-1]